MTKKQIPSKPKANTVAIPADPNALKKLKISLGIIIGLFAFIIYAQSISFKYTLDDHFVISDNEIIKQGLSSIPTILKTDYFLGFNNGDYSGPIYRPASLILFAIEWQFFPDSPHFYHFIHVLLFAITCLILYLVLCKLFESQNVLFPFICTLIYTLHPIHTEVVNSLKSGDELLCFLFGILSVYFAVKSVSEKFKLNLSLSALCYLMSSISKETGITFLIIIPLTVYYFTDASRKKIVTISIVTLAVSAIYLLIRYEVLQSIKLNTGDTFLYNSLAGATSFISREATAFYVLLRFILILIFPHPLTYDYNYSQIKVQSISDLPAIAGIVVSMVLGIYALVKLPKKSIVSFGILFFFITISPVSNLFILNGASMAERFLFTPSLGFCMVLTYFLMKFTKAETRLFSFHNISTMLRINSTLFIMLFILLGIYSIKTFSRNTIWKDNFSIYDHDVETSDNSATAHSNLAISILVDVYPYEKNEDIKQSLLDKSISEFNKSIAIYPDNAKMYEGLGLIYMKKNDNENAKKNYEKAIQLNSIPDMTIFENLASIYRSSKQYEKEISCLDSMIKYNHKADIAYIRKGVVYGQTGKDSLSNEMFLKAISINPKSTEALKDLGVNYGTLKQYKKALEYFNKSLAVDSTDVECYKFIGMTYQNIGDTQKAKQYFEKANKMNGGQQR